ncbi:MAG: helix-turn-helix domain-containing protein [Maritimibacter sp.]|nr:helix-turn-helix domain-containing protein [Maritimibacter sp.]
MGVSHSPGVRRDAAAPPNWLPTPVRTYLAHTEAGTSIRALARKAGVHPSTVLRQVRRTEMLRDDPLADAALNRLGRFWKSPQMPGRDTSNNQDPLLMTAPKDDDLRLARETLRVLRALLEPDTLLVIADGVEDAVVVHNAGDGRPVRRAVLTRDVAEALVLKEFIAGAVSGRLARYAITPAGRSEVRRLLAETESRRASARGQAEDTDVIDAGDMFLGAETGRTARKRTAGAESPLTVLARRKRGDGAAWLPPDLVAAGLRFRESWEIARLGGELTRDWDKLVAGRVSSGGSRVASGGGATRRLEAEEALNAAIRALGPDMAETVILAVCQDLGMEDIEDRLEFPARSGKIVLRIALNMLARHYAATGSKGYDLIY